MHRTQLASLLLAVAALSATALSAMADVGLNFRRDNGAHPVDPAEAAGLVPQPNWNNVVGVAGNNAGTNVKIAGPVAGSLVNHTGVVVPSMSVAWHANTVWNAPNGDGVPGAANGGASGDMMAGYIDDTGTFGITRVDFSGIPYAHYDVIAYFGSDANGRTGEVSLLGHSNVRYATNSLNFATIGFVANPPAGFPLSAGNSNTVRFSGMSGSSFILTNRRISNNVGVHGVQIVEMPGPAPGLPSFPASEVGHWAFEGDVTDAIAANNGVTVGGAGFAPGMFGQALSLNGTGQYAQVSGNLGTNPNFPLVQPPQNMAMSLWAKSTEVNSPAELASMGDHWGLRMNTNTSMHFFQDVSPTATGAWVGLTTNNLGPTEILPNDGLWHHIVAQKTSTHLEIYIDGALALGSLLTGSESLMPTQELIDYAGLGTDLFFGRHGNGGTGNDLNGMIDEVHLFWGNLTQQEINNLRQFNTTVPEPSTFVLAALGGVLVLTVARRRRPR